MRLESRPEVGGLELPPSARTHVNLSAGELYEHAIRRGEVQVTAAGSLCATTGSHTGRSPRDRYLVRRPESEGRIWWHPGNQGVEPEIFDRLLSRALARSGGADVFIQDRSAGDPATPLRVRIVTELAWHSLFSRNLLRPDPRPTGEPDATVVAMPSVLADAKGDGLRSGTFILLDLDRKLVVIGGTRYAGEIKKAVFSLLNHLMPDRGVLPMHCAANRDESGRVALFFGLSGTGKTTLSADPHRLLIGDDEHGWGDEGVFNFEGGCYAKTLGISAEAEPEIYAATNRFGTVVENVVLDPQTRIPDFGDGSLTENCRAAYPLEVLPIADSKPAGGHPDRVLFLSLDTFGVLPPLAHLSPDQIRFFFLSGYTAKVAGTEHGVDQPTPTFSTCFAAPFLPRRPELYADMLLDRIRSHGTEVWMLNTGFVGSASAERRRVPLAVTRALVQAVLNDELSGVPRHAEPVFGLEVPDHVPGIPDRVLDPRGASGSAEDFDRVAARLRQAFQENLAHLAEGGVAAG